MRADAEDGFRWHGNSEHAEEERAAPQTPDFGLPWVLRSEAAAATAQEHVAGLEESGIAKRLRQPELPSVGVEWEDTRDNHLDGQPQARARGLNLVPERQINSSMP